MKLNQSRIIIRHEAILPTDDRYEYYSSSSGYKEYLQDEEVHPQLNNEQKPEKVKKSIKEYLAREGEWENKGGLSHLQLWTNKGKEYIPEPVVKGSNIYSFVISFDPELSKQKNFTDKELKIYTDILYKNIMSNMVNEFNSKYFKYYATAHRRNMITKDHPMDHTHIHFVLYQPENTPSNFIATRYKLKQRIFKQTQMMIGLKIPELNLISKQEVFEKKQSVEQLYKEYLQKIKDNKINLHSLTESTTDKMLNSMKKTQAQLFKLFRAQPQEHKYFDKKTNKWVEKTGIQLSYDNLLVPTYTLADLKLVKQNKKKLSECKKEVSQTQIIAKNEIDKFVATIISADKNLNKTNKKFVDFCEKYENNLVKNLAGNPKNPDAKNGFANFVKEDLNDTVFNDFKRNLGNETIRCVTALNTSKSGNARTTTSRRKKLITRIQSKVASGYVSSHYSHSSYSPPVQPSLFNLVFLYQYELEKQLRKQRNIDKHNSELEEMAKQSGIDVDKFKELNK